MFYKSKNDGYQQVMQGVALKTMVFGIILDSIAVEVFSPMRQDCMTEADTS